MRGFNMPTLLEYINQLQKEHRYRIKMAFAPSERQLEVLERHMKKYDALEVGRPEKLMLQAQPMDFPQLSGHEIVIVDVVTRLPVSMPALEAELRSLLFVKDGLIRVFGRDEPVEKQMEEDCEPNTEAKLGTDYTEAEANAVSADQATGDKYVQSLLKDLDNHRSEAKANIVKMEAKSDAKMSDPTWEGPSDGKTSPVNSSIKNPMPTAKGIKR
jgi:hypothetical protein